MGKIDLCDKIMIENQKKRKKIGRSKKFDITLHLKDRFQMEFTARELMPERALTSFTLYVTHRLSLVCGSGIVIDVKGQAQNI